MLEKGQIRLLNLAREKLGLNADEMDALLMEHGGVDSIGDLTPDAFIDLMDHLREMGFRENLPTPKDGRMINMVTPLQKARISEFEEELGWKVTPGRLRGFIMRKIKTDRVLTSEQAEQVIEGLAALAGRELEFPPEEGKKRE